MKSKRKAFLSTGTASIVLIFVLLCLLTFSVLSLVSAKADLNLSRKSAGRTTEYYEAENTANDILLTITECFSRHAGSASLLTEVRNDLEGQNGISFSAGDSLQYYVTINENQELFVSLQLFSEPSEDGSCYRIDAWKVETIHDWKNDTSVPVLTDDSMNALFSEE